MMFTRLFFALVAFICLTGLNVVIAQNSIIPIGLSSIFTSGILSASADSTGSLWIIASNNTKGLYCTNATDGSTKYLLDITAGAPGSAMTPIASRVRAVNLRYGPAVVYVEDTANNWIAVIDTFTGQWYNTIDVYGFRTFVVSFDGAYLAIGGVRGSDHVNFIDIYNTATGQHVSRVDLDGLDAKVGFSLLGTHQMSGVTLWVPLGNNSISAYDISSGLFEGNQAWSVADFNVSSVVIDAQQYLSAMVDCSRGKVYFPHIYGQTIVYSLSRFNKTLCSESVSIVDKNKFAVLDGMTRYEFFGLAQSTATYGDSATTFYSSHVTTGPFIVLGVLILLSLALVVFTRLYRRHSMNKLNLELLIPQYNKSLESSSELA